MDPAAEGEAQALAYASAAFDAGHLAVAEAWCERALQLNSDSLAAINCIGVIAFRDGRLAQAEKWLERAIALDPREPQFHLNLGKVLRQQLRPGDAVRALERAVALAPQLAQARLNLSLALWEQGDAAASLAQLQPALALIAEPQQLAAWGRLLARQDRPAHAAECLRAALRACPHDMQLQVELTRALLAAGRGDELDAADLEARWADRRSAEVAIVVGAIRLEHGDLTGAEASLRAALRADPSAAEAYYHLAEALGRQGRDREALAASEQACRLAADVAEGRLALAQALLRLGRFEPGWEHYEWRHRLCGAIAPASHLPRWNGEPLAGKRVLLQAEQGFGDTIQFVRYARELQVRGAEVVLECQPTLVSLMRSARGVSRVVARGERIDGADYSCLLMSLPRLLGTTLQSIPWPGPYLAAAAHLRAQWEARLSHWSGPKIGVAWAGSPSFKADRRRSLPLAALTPLLETAGMTFFSLQVGGAATELRRDPRAQNVVDLTSALRDFADTAALIHGLELVISADTAVAHLAGALGKPVWLLTRLQGDWRWLVRRDDTPWYPSMRIFRQVHPGDWEAPLAQARAALRGLPRAIAAAPPATHATRP